MTSHNNNKKIQRQIYMRQLLYDLTLITWVIVNHLALLLTMLLQAGTYVQYPKNSIIVLLLENRHTILLKILLQSMNVYPKPYVSGLTFFYLQISNGISSLQKNILSGLVYYMFFFESKCIKLFSVSARTLASSVNANVTCLLRNRPTKKNAKAPSTLSNRPVAFGA